MRLARRVRNEFCLKPRKSREELKLLKDEVETKAEEVESSKTQDPEPDQDTSRG